jgi:hypothetical protein
MNENKVRSKYQNTGPLGLDLAALHHRPLLPALLCPTGGGGFCGCRWPLTTHLEAARAGSAARRQILDLGSRFVRSGGAAPSLSARIV